MKQKWSRLSESEKRYIESTVANRFPRRRVRNDSRSARVIEILAELGRQRHAMEVKV